MEPYTPTCGPFVSNAVQSPNPPYVTHAFPNKHSINCPIVIREGRACGLIIKSGRMPSFVKGMSSSGIIKPSVPFCPALEAILSPMAGMRSSRMRIFAIRVPSSPSVINDLSTYPS